MFHISDLKKYTRCPRSFWLANQKTDESYMRFLRIDEAVSELVMKKLRVSSYFVGEKNDPCSRAMAALENNEWLVKARFEYNELRVKIPVMHQENGKWDLFFISISMFPKEDDLQYYSSNVWVLQQLGIEVGEIYIVYLNKEYVRKEELDEDELFIVTDHFTTAKGTPTGKITEVVKGRLQNLTPILDEMRKVLLMEDYPVVKNKNCIRRVRCTYYPECFEEEESYPDDSIMTLVSSQKKNEMLKRGILTLKEADLNDVEGSRQQYAQIMASRNGGLFVDKLALKTWMETSLVEPISYLDFEWETYAIPPYAGLKPFDVLPFEYSLHKEVEGQMKHFEYVGVKDCRRELIERLIQDLPKSGSILAYNGDAAEKIRILELARQFPEYEEELVKMSERIVDLSIPFMNGLVYDVKMRGFYSMKVLLSVFSNEYNYQTLAIHHGMDAVFKWRNLDKENHSEENITEELMEYCGMDTLAMIVVVEWLKSQIGD